MTGVDRRQPELDPLVREAIKIREKLYPQLDDDTFARQILAISPSYWSKIKRGEVSGRGGRFVRHLLRRFPHLALFLASDFPNGSAGQKAPSDGTEAA